MTTETLPDFAPRVRRGAALLDRVRPGWERELNLDHLNQGVCSRCVLGQLLGSFWLAFREGGLLDFMSHDESEEQWDKSSDLGFALRIDEEHHDDEVENERYQALTDAWRSLVRERLSREAQS